MNADFDRRDAHDASPSPPVPITGMSLFLLLENQENRTPMEIRFSQFSPPAPPNLHRVV
jgi:hypothetical protein